MSDNVITFPKEKLKTVENVQSKEELLQSIVEYKMSYANEISELLSNYIFGELARTGVDFNSDIDDLFHSMILVSESIQSLHLKASGVHHPLQDFAEDVFGDSDEEDDEPAESLVDNSEKIDYNDLIDNDDGE